MRIEVTLEDINKGKRDNCRKCPVALAVQRVMPPGYKADIDQDYISYLDKAGIYHILCNAPAKVTTFIKRFDAGKPVKPFTFTIKEAKNAMPTL